MPVCPNCPNYTEKKKMPCYWCKQSKEGGNIFTDLYNKVRRNVRVVLFGPYDLSEREKKILRTHGEKVIRGCVIYRRPVHKAITNMFNLATLGGLQQAVRETPYDDLFHLSIDFELMDGTKIRVEKLELVTFTARSAYFGRAEADEHMETTDFPPITFKKAIAKTKAYMGKYFAPYDAKHNNCQHFVLAILHANGVSNPLLENFIKQDTSTIFTTNPVLRTLSRMITDPLARASNVLNGAGF
jgi:hypothetical protein